jgi:uncharacterized protein YyaL (SSP411 family)
MAHESFEDTATASEMNSLFVNVKVDREERPDVDAIYMEAVQRMTGRGGWPMTVWLTPEGRPFYAGTYFPADDRHGMPSFRRVMAGVADAWRQRRADMDSQADQLTALIAVETPPSDRLPGLDHLMAAAKHLDDIYDHVNGGFGSAPKFPQQPLLDFALRVSGEKWAPQAKGMVRQTLLNIARGGIHDHLGGGFARYSVDSHWLVPHFEKMLYDNAQLARLYLWAFAEWGEDRFRKVAESTLEYMLTDLAHPDGGLFSGEDADSEGVEGKFYVWSSDEFMEVAGSSDGPLAAAHYGVTREGNFEGANILHEARSVKELAEEFALSEATVRETIEQAGMRMLDRRRGRVRPGLDDKVVTSWNGLGIRALAEAAAVLESDRYMDAARRAARFVLERLRRSDGRLLRSWAKGRPGEVTGFVEDYAAMAVGLFALYQASGEVEWYLEAARLTREIPRLFADPGGGFFLTAVDAEALIKRPKDPYDNPLPSGNSLAAEALLTLSLFSGDLSHRDAAESAIRSAAMMIDKQPSAVGHLLSVLYAINRGTREVAVVGQEGSALSRVFWERYRPHMVLACDDDGEGASKVPLLEGRGRPGETLAYVCEGFTCLAPVGTAVELREVLSKTRATSQT